jgi:hypothetical protein
MPQITVFNSVKGILGVQHSGSMCYLNDYAEAPKLYQQVCIEFAVSKGKTLLLQPHPYISHVCKPASLVFKSLT